VSRIPKLILALDVSDRNQANDIVDRYKDHIGIFKVGLELFSSSGPEVLGDIAAKDCKIFLDLKFHDIPTTVSRAATAAVRAGVFMFNVHASGGHDMMKKCADTVVELCLRENINRPKILAVTLLTSIDDRTLRDEIGVQYGVRTHVRHLAALALKAGLDGVVASAREAETVRNHCGTKFLIVSPGIRPSWTQSDDQKRTMTPSEALRAGADYLVMGRSVLMQKDPAAALEMVRQEMFASGSYDREAL
jgi:orotidine-5'-phosphate decarboxylase